MSGVEPYSDGYFYAECIVCGDSAFMGDQESIDQWRVDHEREKVAHGYFYEGTMPDDRHRRTPLKWAGARGLPDV